MFENCQTVEDIANEIDNHNAEVERRYGVDISHRQKSFENGKGIWEQFNNAEFDENGFTNIFMIDRSEELEVDRTKSQSINISMKSAKVHMVGFVDTVRG